MPAETEEAWERRNTQQNWQILEVMDEISRARAGTTHAQIALAWLLAQPAVSSVIMGVRSMSQLENNLGAVAIELSPSELHNLDKVSALEEAYPYRFLQLYGSR
jgi:aryl-alcohol dehydrogenase-like predicted oxidoreductase